MTELINKENIAYLLDDPLLFGFLKDFGEGPNPTYRASRGPTGAGKTQPEAQRFPTTL